MLINLNYKRNITFNILAIFLILAVLFVYCSPAFGKERHIKLNKEGYRFLKEENYKKAVERLEEAIKEEPEFVVAYNNLGSAYYNLKKYDLAIKCFEHVISQDTNYVKAYVNLASCHFWKGNFKKAYKYYSKSKSIDEKYVNRRLDEDKMKEAKGNIEDKKKEKAIQLYLKEIKK